METGSPYCGAQERTQRCAITAWAFEWLAGPDNQRSTTCSTSASRDHFLLVGPHIIERQMNTALGQTRGPKQTAESAKGRSSLPAAFLGMARQMGLKPEDLKDADKYWTMLDDLSTSDPTAYSELQAESQEYMEEEHPEFLHGAAGCPAAIRVVAGSAT